jgi:hypothetical protein
MDIYAPRRSRPLRRGSLDLTGLRGFVAEAPPESFTTPRTGGGWRFAVGVIVAGILATTAIILLIDAVARSRGF